MQVPLRLEMDVAKAGSKGEVAGSYSYCPRHMVSPNVLHLFLLLLVLGFADDIGAEEADCVTGGDAG